MGDGVDYTGDVEIGGEEDGDGKHQESDFSEIMRCEVENE
jgi:hypothetical protein